MQPLYFEGYIIDRFTSGISLNGPALRLAVAIKKPAHLIDADDLIAAAEHLEERARRVQTAVRRRQ